ncbi:Uncharacterised protein [Mycobacteroides abscessus]|nr:Uncharacterised protein [Mycobacteroides abscessus]
MISLIACEMRVASSRPSPVSVRTPCLSSRFATTVSRSTLPVRSPYPFTVPCTCAAPASTAASVFATAQPESLCACIPSSASPGSASRPCGSPTASRSSATVSATHVGSMPPFVSHSATTSAPASNAACTAARVNAASYR